MIDRETSRPLPLHGIKVLDFGQALQGPYASFLLAMSGADVLKVEGLSGEMTRQAGPVAAYIFEINNTQKRSIAIDLKTADGKQVILDLVKQVDVVLENFAPGVMDRLGIGSKTLLDINPRLVYASGTGYGAVSARRDDVAMDSTIQAMSGLLAATGDPNGPPMRAGLPVADVLSGAHLYGAVVTALVEAKTSGIGRVVEVAMLEAMFSLQCVNMNVWHTMGRQLPPRWGNRHGTLSPLNIYATKNGWIQLMCGNDRQWQSLTKAMHRDDLGSDERFKNFAGRLAARDKIDDIVASWVAGHDRDDVLAILLNARVPAAAVRTLVEVLEDQDLRDRGFLHDIEHPVLGNVPMPGSALRFDGSEALRPKPTVPLGANTEEILAELVGMDEVAILRLRAEKAIL